MNAADGMTIAIVDDDPDIRSALREMLALDGFASIEFDNAESALARIDTSFHGIVVSDVRMPGLDGVGLFNRLLRLDPELPVIMMSGHGDIETAVDLVRRGAYDFLSKPFDVDALMATVRRAIEKRGLILENRNLREHAALPPDGSIIGESPEIVRLRDVVAQLAQADIDVLITGESGVGKNLIAGALHRRSPRARKPMITIDCDALPIAQAESLLFGHVSGAYPGAQFPRTGQLVMADGSTLFLDHVDGLARPLQARLQQALEQGSVLPMGANMPQNSIFRTIAATSSDLAAKVADGMFDRSLYFRIGGYQLAVPPLRARRGDIVTLFRAFLVQASTALNRDPPMLSPAVWRRLHDHDWPGNVRELRSFATNVAIGLGDPAGVAARSPADDSNAGLKARIAAFEAETIRSVLDRNGGDVAATISELQLPRKTFYDKLARLAINPKDYRGVRRN